jgi:hypothetical protein
MSRIFTARRTSRERLELCLIAESTASRSRPEPWFNQIGIDSVMEGFGAFVNGPTPEAFLLLRTLVTNLPTYKPYADEMPRLERLYENGQFEEVRAAADQIMANYLLTPRIHLIAGLAAARVGDHDSEQSEAAAFRACIKGILSTGDGIEDRPYLITHVTEEYDILDRLNKRPSLQALVKSNSGYCDKLTCEDGTAIWFDVTDPLLHLEKTLGLISTTS